MTPPAGPPNAPDVAAFLDFEKPIAELDARIAELRETAEADGAIDIETEVGGC